MLLFNDVHRFRTDGVLPWGTSAGDQDAVFWTAVAEYDSAAADVASELRARAAVAEKGD